LLGYCVDHGLDAFLVRNITGHADRRAAHVANGFHDVIGARDIRQRYLGALFGETDCIGLADLSTAAGNDDRFVLKAHGCLLSRNVLLRSINIAFRRVSTK
jgi:hypothetical protein